MIQSLNFFVNLLRCPDICWEVEWEGQIGGRLAGWLLRWPSCYTAGRECSDQGLYRMQFWKRSHHEMYVNLDYHDYILDWQGKCIIFNFALPYLKTVEVLT
jgi:hypothetical protein